MIYLQKMLPHSTLLLNARVSGICSNTHLFNKSPKRFSEIKALKYSSFIYCVVFQIILIYDSSCIALSITIAFSSAFCPPITSFLQKREGGKSLSRTHYVIFPHTDTVIFPPPLLLGALWPFTYTNYCL